jgi:hypothetical protein
LYRTTVRIKMIRHKQLSGAESMGDRKILFSDIVGELTDQQKKYIIENFKESKEFEPLIDILRHSLNKTE